MVNLGKDLEILQANNQSWFLKTIRLWQELFGNFRENIALYIKSFEKLIAMIEECTLKVELACGRNSISGHLTTGNSASRKQTGTRRIEEKQKQRKIESLKRVLQNPLFRGPRDTRDPCNIGSQATKTSSGLGKYSRSAFSRCNAI